MEEKKSFLDRDYIFGYTVMEFIGWMLLAIGGMTLFFTMTAFVLADKKINGYYLGTEGGALVMKTDIEYYQDFTTKLNGLTFDEAVQLVNDLNENVK